MFICILKEFEIVSAYRNLNFKSDSRPNSTLWSTIKSTFLKLRMPKLRKVKRKQKFRFDRNRKRVKKSQELHLKKNIKVDW